MSGRKRHSFKEKQDFSQVKYEKITDGLCIQAMHKGSFDDEAETFTLMEEFAAAEGYELIHKEFHHREIYLSDFRKTALEKLKPYCANMHKLKRRRRKHNEKTDWSEPLRERLPQEYFSTLVDFINDVYSQGNVYPPEDKIFRAIELTALADVKVVLVGQDPYPQPGKAQGLSFSYPASFVVNRPDSIVNIRKELKSEGFDKEDSDLTHWAEQGVLLLNAVLTVPEMKSNAHKGKIWEPLTDEIIKIASDDDRPKVFLLWG